MVHFSLTTYTGRPSYFPTENELIDSFNVKNFDRELTPQQDPYFEKITLEGFDDEQIKQSILLYKFSGGNKKRYIDFIFSNKSILDLCKRPSMMHIIREMLPKLYSEHETQNLNPGNLMRQYIDHWITRQLEKDIVSAVEDKRQKREFVWEFFRNLARIYYLKGLEAMPSNEIAQIISWETSKLRLTDASDIDGFETELLSGFFIEIEDIGYKFVHKSFKEFFISSEIINSLQQKEFKDPLLFEVEWTKEINDFVFDGYSQNKELTFDQDQTPYLWLWYGYSGNQILLLKRFTQAYIKIVKSMTTERELSSGYLRSFKSLLAISTPSDILSVYTGVFLTRLLKNNNVKIGTFVLRSYYYCYLKDNSLIKHEIIKDVVQIFENLSAKKVNRLENKNITVS